MYGGLAAAMQENNQNAFRVFGLKNQLDQQRLRQAQLDRQNAIQDRGLLMEEQDRSRRQKIEDERMGMEREQFSLGKQDRARKQSLEDQARGKADAERLKAEGLQDVIRELMTKGTLDANGVEKFNAIGKLKLIERSDAASLDPATGAVRLRWADDSATEMPLEQFAQVLGLNGGAPVARGSGTRGAGDDDGMLRVRRADELTSLAESLLKDFDGADEALAAKDAEIQTKKGKYKEAYYAGLNGDTEETLKLKAEIEALENEKNTMRARVMEARARADQLRAQAATELQQGPAQPTGGVRRLPPGGLWGTLDQPAQAAPAGGGGLVPEAAPRGESMTPEQARAELDAVENTVSQESAGKNDAKLAKEKASDKPSFTTPVRRFGEAVDVLGKNVYKGLMGAGMGFGLRAWNTRHGSDGMSMNEAEYRAMLAANGGKEMDYHTASQWLFNYRNGTGR